MRYAMVMMLALAAGCSSLSAGLGEPGAMIPDPNYQPRDGDRAVLYATEGDQPMDPMPLLGDMTAYDKFERAVEARSAEDLRDLEERRWLKWTPIGTRVLVKSVRDRSHAGAHVGAEVLVLEGPHKDTTAWVPAGYITRLIQAPEE